MVSSRQHRFFKFARFHSVQDTFLIVLFVTLVTLGNLGIGVWEVCRHDGGEAHLFLSGDPPESGECNQFFRTIRLLI